MFKKMKAYANSKSEQNYLGINQYIGDIKVRNMANEKDKLSFESLKSFNGIQSNDEPEYLDGQVIEYDDIRYKILSVEDLTVEVANNQDKLGAIKIPNTIKDNEIVFDVISIGESAFSRSAISSIVLPTTPYTINDFAFFQTSILKEAVLNAATSIGCAAFRNSGIEEIQMPTCLYRAEFQSFWGTSLRSIDFRKATGFGNELLGYSKVEEVILPNMPYDVSYKMFSEAFDLKHLDLSNARLVGKQAFLVTYGMTLFFRSEFAPIIESFSFLAAENLTIIYPDTINFDKFSRAIDNGWGACTKRVRYDGSSYRNINTVEGETIKIGYSFDLVLDDEQIQFCWYKDGVKLQDVYTSMLTIKEITKSSIGSYELEIIIPKTGTSHKMGIKYIKVMSRR